MKRWTGVGVFFVLYILVASLWVNPAEAINHKVKVVNTTKLICYVKIYYGVLNMWGERHEKGHQFYANEPNASVTFETGTKCPAELHVACGNNFNEYLCFDGRRVSGEGKCALSCWGSDWFIRDSGNGEAKVTKE